MKMYKEIILLELLALLSVAPISAAEVDQAPKLTPEQARAMLKEVFDFYYWTDDPKKVDKGIELCLKVEQAYPGFEATWPENLKELLAKGGSKDPKERLEADKALQEAYNKGELITLHPDGMLANLYYYRKKDFFKAAEWAQIVLQREPHARGMATMLWNIRKGWVAQGMALPPVVFVNNRIVPSTVQQKEKYRLWVDLPKMLEAARVGVKIDKAKQIATLNLPAVEGSRVVNIKLEDGLLNNSNLPKEIAPKFIGERLMAPVEFLEQYFEVKTKWVKRVEYLIITTSEKTIVPRLCKLLNIPEGPTK